MSALLWLARMGLVLLAFLCVATGLLVFATGHAVLTMDARFPVRTAGLPAYAWGAFWVCLGAFLAALSLRGLAFVPRCELKVWQARLAVAAAFFFALAIVCATARMLYRF